MSGVSLAILLAAIAVSLFRTFRKRKPGVLPTTRNAILDLCFSLAGVGFGAWWWVDTTLSPTPVFPTEGVHIGYTGSTPGKLIVIAASLAVIKAIRDLSISVPTPQEPWKERVSWRDRLLPANPRRILVGAWRNAHKDSWLVAALVALAVGFGVAVAAAAGGGISFPIVALPVLFAVALWFLTSQERTRLRQATLVWACADLLVNLILSLVATGASLPENVSQLAFLVPLVGYISLILIAASRSVRHPR
jgi:hypothetical protein